MVKYDPEVHCPPIGPSGGDMCIGRDYIEVTNTMPFNTSMLAYNSSYNPLDFRNVPIANQEELIKVNTEILYMTSVALVSAHVHDH